MPCCTGNRIHAGGSGGCAGADLFGLTGQQLHACRPGALGALLASQAGPALAPVKSHRVLLAAVFLSVHMSLHTCFTVVTGQQSCSSTQLGHPRLSQ